ncbi:hypothetical protein T492DRAFT_854873 [Pavlovales sp. CCMP2436]|nr:hypothetical protein T492DRAFT_854873 [Pavlovales sp. CCMP2436]
MGVGSRRTAVSSARRATAGSEVTHGAPDLDHALERAEEGARDNRVRHVSSGARGTWALGTGASSAVPCRAFISASGEARAADPASVVQVYSTVGCPYCMRAKKKLAELGVPYDEFDVTGDEALRSKIAKLTARR